MHTLFTITIIVFISINAITVTGSESPKPKSDRSESIPPSSPNSPANQHSKLSSPKPIQNSPIIQPPPNQELRISSPTTTTPTIHRSYSVPCSPARRPCHQESPYRRIPSPAKQNLKVSPKIKRSLSVPSSLNPPDSRSSTTKSTPTTPKIQSPSTTKSTPTTPKIQSPFRKNQQDSNVSPKEFPSRSVPSSPKHQDSPYRRKPQKELSQNPFSRVQYLSQNPFSLDRSEIGETSGSGIQEPASNEQPRHSPPHSPPPRKTLRDYLAISIDTPPPSNLCRRCSKNLDSPPSTPSTPSTPSADPADPADPFHDWLRWLGWLKVLYDVVAPLVIAIVTYKMDGVRTNEDLEKLARCICRRRR